MKNPLDQLVKDFNLLVEATVPNVVCDPHKVATVVQSFRDAAVPAPTKGQILDETTETAGEVLSCFNVILRQGAIGLGHSPVFNGTLSEASRLRCIAAVLLAISNLKEETVGNENQHRHGWDALNSDAKGWCQALLSCEITSDVDASTVREMLTAKALVGQLVAGGNEPATTLLKVTDTRDPVKLDGPDPDS